MAKDREVKVRVVIRFKNGAPDHQGGDVLGSLRALGYGEVEGIKTSKMIILTLHGVTRPQARARTKEMCEELLTNPVIEQYEIELI